MTTHQAPSPQAKLSFLSRGHGWIMGVLNATPDSFYAGARTMEPEAALRQAELLLTQGADLIDIGGESTRPGSQPVSLDEERRRVLPVIEALLAKHPQAVISVDTQKAVLAREALKAGASLINDVSALRSDPAMADVIAEAQCPVVLMHMQGTPETMQQAPRYGRIIDEVNAFFEERLRFVTRRGIHERAVILDPGIGFGKTLTHNLLLLRYVSVLKTLKRPLLIGVSRKSSIGQLLGTPEKPLPVEDRLEGSLAAALWALSQGANGLRVHDVQATKRAVAVWQAIEKTQ